MPGVIANPVLVGVFPQSLSTKFVSSNRYESLEAEYHDGTTERSSLVSAGRRTWTMSKRLTPAEASTLRAWFDAHTADAFYFYDLREGTWDPSGVSVAGRYMVRFDSDFAQTMTVPRLDLSVTLIEIGPGGTDPGVVLSGPRAYPHGLPTTATLYYITSHIPGTGYDGVAAISRGSGYELFDSTSWTDRTDSNDWTSVDNRWGASVGPAVIIADPVDSIVSFFIVGTILGSASPGDIFRVFDCYMDITYADSTTIRYRPQTAVVASGSGTVTGAPNAIDTDATTYAEITRVSFGVFDGAKLVLSNFRPE